MKTDVQLQNDVTEQLRCEPSVTSIGIQVAAINGMVTLTGQVPTYREKCDAERTTLRVAGVKDITDEINVVPQAGHQREDSELADAVAKTLKWHVWVPSVVRASIENGWITLTGDVKWEFQLKAAEDSVSHLHGVKRVTNNISIKPSIQPVEIQDAIERALKRNAVVDSENIFVSADAGKVTLTGTIYSQDERQAAEKAAWNAPGVTEVHNKLAILSRAE